MCWAGLTLSSPPAGALGGAPDVLGGAELLAPPAVQPDNAANAATTAVTLAMVFLDLYISLTLSS